VNCLFPIITAVLLMIGVNLPAASHPTAYAMEEGNPQGLNEAENQVFEEESPAVVHIEVTRREEVNFPYWFYEMSPFLKSPEKSPDEKPDWQNRGTGVLIDEKGHTLTNYHIVGQATKLQVVQTDGRRFPARLLGADPKTDLAVIQLLVYQPISYATFGDSDALGIGDRVLSIGYGIGRGQILNRGVVTAKPKGGMTDLYDFNDLMRIDIPVHSANTGGPLLNLRGEVVGINSALMTRFSGTEGIGFAIPSRVVKRVAESLITKGKVPRGWLGVEVQDVTPYLASSVGLKEQTGILVTEVVSGGPADRAGLRAGDIVTIYRQHEIPSKKHFRHEVDESTPGEKVALTVIRDKKRRQVPVVIGNLEETISDPTLFIRHLLGVDVRPITSREADQYGLDSRQGVVVVGAYPGSPLVEVGFELNDVIMEVEGRPIKGLRPFIDQIISMRGKQRVIMLGLDHRTGRTGFVQVVVP